MAELAENQKENIRKLYYYHVHRNNKGRNEPRWRGVRTVKFPSDLILYSEVIYEKKPDFIIECGTRFGGSTTFFADMLKLFNPEGKVISIDIEDFNPPKHENVEYVIGSSIDPEIFNKIKERVSGKKVMVILDSDHTTHHVKKELRLYSKLVTKGQYISVEDVWTDKRIGPGPAIDWFLTKTNRYKLVDLTNRFIVGVTRDGWLLKVK